MRKQRGFTLIELLIVVAIIGIIAAIAIPNLLDAIERSRQKRSTAELKTIAEALQAFSTDYGGYPANAHAGDPSVTLSQANYLENGPAGNGQSAFCPDYIQAVPIADGWGTAYTLNMSLGAPNAQPNARLGEVVAVHFTLGCLGNDKAPSASANDVGASDYVTVEGLWNVQPPALPTTGITTPQTHCYITDIIWGDSSFLQAPEGKQKNC